ncbi:dihydroorotate dehydrogenase, partial [Candidatus Roizmanbacteria bacterium CG11_big_fil_rev_8_21_14_0_20_36_8]
MLDLSINLAGIPLKNPTILASGIMGVSSASLRFCEENGAGAVTLKSIGSVERSGHANPTVIVWEKGIQNAVGLSNPGIDGSIEKIEKAVKTLSIPLIGSMFADTIKNFKTIALKMAETGVAGI